MMPDIAGWEDEGGAVRLGPVRLALALTGTPNQIEWAEIIRRRVNTEFDRIAATLRSAEVRQTAGKRAETELILAVLEENRAQVLSRREAGYFIHDWQEIGDQVRRMIASDARVQAIRTRRLAGTPPSDQTTKGNETHGHSTSV